MDNAFNHASVMTWGWFNEGPSNDAAACPAGVSITPLFIFGLVFTFASGGCVSVRLHLCLHLHLRLHQHQRQRLRLRLRLRTHTCKCGLRSSSLGGAESSGCLACAVITGRCNPDLGTLPSRTPLSLNSATLECVLPCLRKLCEMAVLTATGLTRL
jgi:hypothetical protein